MPKTLEYIRRFCLLSDFGFLQRGFSSFAVDTALLSQLCVGQLFVNILHFFHVTPQVSGLSLMEKKASGFLI